jgi:hypothetical protein
MVAAAAVAGVVVVSVEFDLRLIVFAWQPASKMSAASVQVGNFLFVLFVARLFLHLTHFIAASI